MSKTVALSERRTGVLISFVRHEADLSNPKCEHALVFVPWNIVEELLEAVSPRSAHRRGQARGRTIVGVRAAISALRWEWVADDNGRSLDDAFEPVATAFETGSMFIVNGPLPGASEADVTFVLNGPRAGDGLMVVLSAAEVQDFMLSLTALWSDHTG
ncbi:hypothetical protein LL946_06350 [Knoellia locipacati]|uniref:hypothetical protein n=1 Tax=Knoellia locipacati TaxID=882824 RepID=UPI00385024DE